jgi:hypothetical protein
MWLVLVVPVALLLVTVGLQWFEASLGLGELSRTEAPPAGERTEHALVGPVGSSHLTHMSHTAERFTLGAYADPTL